MRCKVPLPDGFEGQCQTKDFDCELCQIEIREDGSLWIERFDQEVVPKAARAYPDAEDGDWRAIVGMLRSVNFRWEQIDFHGIMEFYAHADGWHEYNAKFTDGKLVSIAPPNQETSSNG